MKKILLSLLSVFCYLNIAFTQANIAEARGMTEGSTVTISGIVTNGEELGIIRYLQDNTAGIAAYPGSGSAPNFPETVKRGDQIEVTGTLKSFNGLLEVDPITAFDVVSSNNTLPDAKVISPNEINEANEGQLVKVEGVTFKNGGAVFSVGNFTFDVNGEEGEIYVRSGHALIGTSIPLATVNLTGISSEFSGQYQLLPRDENDLEIADDFYINSPLVQTNLETDGFTISWTTNSMGSSNLRYGTDISDLSNEVNSAAMTTNHSLDITGLEPATFYYVQAFSNNGNTTINSLTKIYSTASNSNGAFQIFFTSEVDGTVSNGSWANGYTPAVMEAAILDRINKAKTSVDVAMYNVNREVLISTLVAAHDRGVQVRYIADNETLNAALSDPAPPFPVIKGNADGLMHNKFFIIDGDSPTDSWIMMGSTNMTSENLANAHNNMIFLQDQSVAKAYTLEFEEIWGTEGPDPAVFNLKFGADKADNTPHLFKVKNLLIESYFSPTDNTSIGIANALKTADNDIQVALLVLTNNELANELLTAKNNGIDVRGIIDQPNSTGSDFDYLQSNGVNLVEDNFSGQTHHKYCIIDANMPDSDPQVITGSHNWSGGADTRNDENTLIFHDKSITNIFLQEFEARWCEAASGNNCTTATEELNEISGFSAQVFPNPAVESTVLEFSLEERNDVMISLWSASGQLIQSRVLRGIQGQHTEQLLLTGLPTGNYFISFNVNGKNAVKQIQVTK